MRFKLETFAEQRLEKLLTGSSSVDSTDLQLLNETDFWALTHGLWLLCSSKANEGQRSHHGFTNYMMGSQWWSLVGMKYAMSFARAVSSELLDSEDRFQATLVGVMSEVDGAHPRDFFHPLVILSIPDKADVFKRWLYEMYEEERRIYGPAYSSRTERKGIANAVEGWKLGLHLWSKAWELTHNVTYSLSISDREHVDLQVWMEWIGSSRSEIDKEMLEADAGAELTGSFGELVVQHDLLEAFYLELETQDEDLRGVLSGLNQAMDGHELGPKLRGVLEAHLPARPVSENPGEWTELHEVMFGSPYGRVWRLLLAKYRTVDLNAIHPQYQWSLLKRAVKHGDAEAVAVLVEARVQVVVDHIHAALGSDEILSSLLNHSDSSSLVNESDGLGLPPLVNACLKNLPEAVTALVGAGADSSWQDGDGNTCWHYAASNGYSACLLALTTNGNRAGIDATDADGQTPLNIVCYRGNLDAVRAFLREGQSQAVDIPNSDGWTPLHSACNRGHLEVVRLLLGEGQSQAVDIPSQNGWTPLNRASDKGHLEVVRFLLQQGNSQAIDVPSKTGWTPLNSASSKGHLEVVRFLIQQGNSQAIDVPNKAGWTPLNSACSNGHLEVVRFLLQQGNSQAIDVPSKAGWTPLNSACDRGHLEVIRLLLSECQSEAALIPNNDGAIPLWCAVVGGHDEIVALLAPLSGSNAKAVVEAGKLFHCARSGTVEDLQSLLQLPFYQDVDSVQFPNGSTAIMFAAEAGRGDLVTVLIDGGSNVNHVGRIGTALHCAAMEGHVHVVSQLLAAGADPSLMDKDSKTALQVAATDEVKALLKGVTPGGEDEK